MGKFKKKASELKAWYKKNEPALAVLGGMAVAAVGWGLAGYYQTKMVMAESRLAEMEDRLRSHEEVDPDAWPTIEISPGAMEDIQNGATLKYREFRIRPKYVYAQFTTLDEFPPEAEEALEEEKRNA